MAFLTIHLGAVTLQKIVQASSQLVLAPNSAFENRLTTT